MKKSLIYTMIVTTAVLLTACGKGKTGEPVTSGVITETSIEATATSDSTSVQESEPEIIIPEATHVGGFTISGDRLTARGGAYDQDGNPDNGAEPIEWIVAADAGDRLLLVSANVLEKKEYNNVYGETSWEKCTLRKWLNEDFYNAAFNDEEKTIITDYVTIPGDEGLGTADITDKVFCLSREEAESYIGAPEGSAGNRLCAPVTSHAINSGVWYIDAEYYELFGFKAREFSEEMIGCGNWWLRSNGKDASRIMDVGASGIIRTTGHEAASDADGVRPAIYISISGGNN